MNILGIDPGLATIGFASLHNDALAGYGVITTKPQLSLPNRLLQISEDMSHIIAEYKPDMCAIEQLFFVKNVTNGIVVSHARGVIIHALAVHGIPIQEVSPKDAKIAVCGYGNAAKDQIQRAVQKIFRLPEIPKPDDAADAIAIAYWGSLQKPLSLSCS